MTNDRRLTVGVPVGHSASQQKHCRVICHNIETQSKTSPPAPYNICLNLTQALLITHSAWARHRQHREPCSSGLHANCVHVFSSKSVCGCNYVVSLTLQDEGAVRERVICLDIIRRSSRFTIRIIPAHMKHNHRKW